MTKQKAVHPPVFIMSPDIPVIVGFSYNNILKAINDVRRESHEIFRVDTLLIHPRYLEWLLYLKPWLDNSGVAYWATPNMPSHLEDSIILFDSSANSGLQPTSARIVSKELQSLA